MLDVISQAGVARREPFRHSSKEFGCEAAHPSLSSERYKAIQGLTNPVALALWL
ncbi:hypothetical protein GCM10025863_02430 [Microbacterium suwonense]|uniref:Uncharacterized protein n=1 Tax=Microbacterium suwonense TaxID=683047 RepID=A0ABM8FPM9_9MICO|nr:hypothetical protein GCM10025863_02430 [Microbacterium suwonense]